MVSSKLVEEGESETYQNRHSCLLEIGIFLSHLIFLARTHRIRKEAAAQGKTFDDIMAEHERRGIPFKFAERKSRGKEKETGDELGSCRSEDIERAEPPQLSTVFPGTERGEPRASLPGNGRKEET